MWHRAANARLEKPYFVERPDITFMRALGCRAYPLNEIGKAIAQHKPISAAVRERVGHPKFGPRAHLGYVIGYGSTLFRKHSTNIYRIWCPGLKSCHTLATRDVTFNEHKRYDPEELDSTHLMTRELGPVLMDFDIQHMLDDVDNAVYAGVPYKLPPELVEEEAQPGQQENQGPSESQDPVQMEGLEDTGQELQKVGYPTPPDSIYTLIQAFATFDFHDEIRKGITYKLHRSQLEAYPPPRNYKAVKNHRFAAQ